MKRFLRVLLLAGLCASCNVNTEGTSSVDIYYYYFGVETALPLTPENIEEEAAYHLSIAASDPDLLNLMSILRTAEEGELYEGAVRVLLTLPDSERVYIDNYGGARINGVGKKLDDFSIAQIKSILAGIIRRSAE